MLCAEVSQSYFGCRQGRLPASSLQSFAVAGPSVRRGIGRSRHVEKIPRRFVRTNEHAIKGCTTDTEPRCTE